MYSHVEAKKSAIKTKIRRAVTMAKAGKNSDFKIAHPDWVRDATKKDFTDLIKKITDKELKYQEFALKRRDKLGGK